jgi:hypothetical protein
MAPLKRDIESVKRLAEKKFLGRYHVIGVGITGKKADRLVFFLERPSKQSQAQIDSWAHSIGIPFEIVVVGKIRPTVTLNITGG